MEKNSGTRSGLLWEVERLLNECTELPQILLMENVPQVHGSKNKVHFDEWIEFLESKGYTNYWQDLNAKNYGIPQNRNRCFMVSILDNKPFEFPEPFELKLRLKDMLEDEVDEKYYLSDTLMRNIQSQLKNTETVLIDMSQARIEGKPREYVDISPTLTSRDYKKPRLIQVGNLSGGKWDKINESCRRVYDSNGIAPTIHTCQGGNTEPKICIKDKNLWTDTQKQMITDDGNVKRYLDSDIVDEFKEGQVADISFPNGYNKAKRVHDECPTINQTTTQSSFIVKVKDKSYKELLLNTQYKKLIDTIEKNELPIGEVKHMDLYNRKLTDNCGTLTDPCHNNNRLWDGLRIRKLTPKECWRLMGFSDIDFDRAAQFISNSQLYKQAGNSIVVDVLENIFRELFLKEQDISSWLDKLLEVA